jgi:transposase InsO family protein
MVDKQTTAGQRISGKGNCYDNSMVETFFKSIKAELIWRNRWDTRRQAEGVYFSISMVSIIRVAAIRR